MYCETKGERHSNTINTLLPGQRTKELSKIPRKANNVLPFSCSEQNMVQRGSFGLLFANTISHNNVFKGSRIVYCIYAMLGTWYVLIGEKTSP